MPCLILIFLSVALLLLGHIIAADDVGYREPVQCQSDSDCPAPTCDVTRGWVRSFCGADDTCQNEANDCNDHVSCTIDSCDPSKGCQHDTAKCGCTDDGQCYDWNPCTTDICLYVHVLVRFLRVAVIASVATRPLPVVASITMTATLDFVAGQACARAPSSRSTPPASVSRSASCGVVPRLQSSPTAMDRSRWSISARTTPTTPKKTKNLPPISTMCGAGRRMAL